MRSMTGFGRATAALGNYSLTVQVSSVNRKTLDLTQKLPSEWDALESDIADQVRQVAARGKVHVAVELTGTGGAGGANEIVWDDAAVGRALDHLAALADQRGLVLHPTAELLWQVASAHRQSSRAPDVDTARETVMRVVREALQAFAVMRAKEGEALLADFLARLETLSRHVAAVAARAPLVTAGFREALLKRLRDAGLDLDVNDERVLKEVALFADRCDITEELTRLGSHLGQFRTLISGKGEIGRKAEFILQEIGREVHTIGSKANDLDIARNVIELKNELERIREQIANVE
ncbi:YicC/YloC family endoribonuclease [Geminisphaera colitermitum]|uniref:YicC/YloC family endoribonuclease n=1 Tax=Geminisphaera colitermitum TaxID=1148786 RepID=UPI000158C8FB|nr:YicC/YloC family endoribonuclease [Geminisphaera colitermitum]